MRKYVCFEKTVLFYLVNSMGYKISGYPTFLPDKKYPRNYLLFNLCVVCHPWSRNAILFNFGLI